MTSRSSKATLLDGDDSILRKTLLLQPGDVQPEKPLTQLLPDPDPLATAVTITPLPGVCIKTRLLEDGGKDDAGTGKVFINVCTSDAIPEPQDLSDQELIDMLESEEDTSDFRVPMSIGAPHQEKDKSGAVCNAYDVVINPKFLTKTRDNILFNNFFVLATMEALEAKYTLKLDKNGWVILKNKLYLGTMPQQTVKTALPLVQELVSRRTGGGIKQNQKDEESEHIDVNKGKHDRIMTPVNTTRFTEQKIQGRKPEWVLTKIFKDGSEEDGRGEVIGLHVDVHLPGLASGTDVAVLAGEDRVVVEGGGFFLDAPLPVRVDASTTAAAHFITNTQTMKISMRIAA